MKVSIVIVNFNAKDKLLACLNSVYGSKPKIEFEVIVVNNDKRETIKQDLLKKFPEVRYFKSSKNLGFGAGNNLGAKYAKGEYLFFLNPDTLFVNNVLDGLYKFIKSDKKISIVAPVLLDINKIEYPKQGTVGLTPFKALLHLSFLSKFFKKSHYYIEGWNSSGLREVDVCPGSALMVSRRFFEKLKGFDENFFLYFEEFDLCKRAKEFNYKIYVTSKAKLIHEWGASTSLFKDKDKVFRKSRFYYFRKHYGIFNALFVESFLRINKFSVSLFLVLLFSLFLRTINLSSSMVFIGDQGWFYLSARDLLLTGQIPLVGITSSHTWLHQGPLWTYMLSIALLVFKFSPISGAYVTALFGAVSTVLMYKLGSEMFSKRVGVIAALLYCVSPRIIFFERMPFDPSSIPLFTLLYLYAMFKWLNGNPKYFSVIIFLIAVLYNLELATFTLFFSLAVFVACGFIRHKVWLKNILNKKIILLSFVVGILPMAPIIIYDFSHGFKQTIVFFGWTLYKPFSFLIKHPSGNLFSNLTSMINFLAVNLQKIIFQFNLEIAILIFILSTIYLCYKNFKKLRIESPEFILLFLLAFLLLGILINLTPSDAYLPIIFPLIIFVVAIFFDYLFSIRLLSFAVLILFLSIILVNSYFGFLLSQGNDLKTRTLVADEIIMLSGGNNYNLIGRGPNSQFESFTMNYEYLLWYKGHPPVKTPVKTKISIAEINGKFIVTRETK